MFERIAVIGAQGAIGAACLQRVQQLYPEADIHAVARQLPNEASQVQWHVWQTDDDQALEASMAWVSESGDWDLVIVATGMLHEGTLMPEKALKQLQADHARRVFEVNALLPLVVAKHFLPRMRKQCRSVFITLSARVGSISDNHLGGWYSYRMSKAALNMFVKSAAIESKRTHPDTLVLAVHPGTVDSHLSKPFQAMVPHAKLFTPAFAAEKILDIAEQAPLSMSGHCLAWNGDMIAA